MRPFACGGAGTVLSGAAVVATDFGACAARFSRTCLQSDWMIGYCLARANVTPVTQFGCNVCSRAYSSAFEVALQEALVARRCHFAQFTFPMERLEPPRHALMLYAFATPAIQHHTSRGASAVRSEALTRPEEKSPFFPLCTAPDEPEPSDADATGFGGAAKDSKSASKLVLIVGAQKAATTSLAVWLQPGMCDSPAAKDEPSCMPLRTQIADYRICR